MISKAAFEFGTESIITREQALETSRTAFLADLSVSSLANPPVA